MNSWQLRRVPFNFQLGDLSLFKVSVPLQVRSERLVDNTAPVRAADAPGGELAAGSEGFVIRALPLAEPAPLVSRIGAYLCYVPQQYEHCYIDLTMGFERYQAKFSSKTRSTIMRKMRKFAELSGGTIDWRTYRREAEIGEFFDLAIALSKTTYQDRLLDAGLPDSAQFRQHALQLARDDSVRAFILFKEGQPVSYLFCPIEEGVLTYSYVGYDPAHMNLSVGTVLQWLAIEQLFGEAKYRYFDFTEGQSDHKRLFATDRRLCGNVFLLRHSLRHRVLIHCHQSMDRFSRWLGVTMERYGIKAHVKRLLRFGR